ncbi:MAG: multicopper oxidase family protein [Nostoc sp. CmiVER01]|uniref:multicopper oxidase family protein n=1 Tax=Nostoc sp. CmiVER01 TaxID=3075384 RepID=UPI002AD3CA85|nr:multicopper oxidase domain-containing protein [Nostoc sp. CmiVER01]MDZ8124026.1 multicopper oxidase domain-containing protein [Nostoc sp. CmiVER01]
MKKRIIRLFSAFVLAIVLTFAPISDSYAKSQLDPCAFQLINLDKYGGEEFANPESVSSQNGSLKVDLKVQYTDKETTEIAGCKVKLRSYNGKLVGPTLRVKPNDLISINLINTLPPEPKQEINMNKPHGFNTTNIHTHGLHVLSTGNSDNVLKEMPPKETDTDPDPNYNIGVKLPANHPSGTFWYHPHKHGSTALQVSSGMVGAIIVEGGGLDEIPAIKNAEDKIFVFQQITYDTKGEIDESYNGFGMDLNQSAWSLSGRQTTINGQIYPTIRIKPGEMQRWRFIHAGVRDALNLSLRPVSISKRIRTQVKLHEIAIDGIALGTIDSWSTLELEPGYRSDVLVQFPSPRNPLVQEYELVDVATPPEKSLLGVPEDEEVLAKVIVEGNPVKLNDDTNPELPGSKKFLADLLKAKQKDAPPDITRIDGRQEVLFDIQLPNQFSDEKAPKFMVNGTPFDINDPNPITLQLKKADEWVLKSAFVNHPFHIHVNPFQYTRKDPNGNDEVIWRDTLLVRQGKDEIIKSRYDSFLGKFVLHCHILDHEDQGMMKLVQIIQ